MTINTDVLVVGLGPGGATAARTAAAAGARVVAIDKKKRIGYPVQCAEFVPAAFASICASHRAWTIDHMLTRLPSNVETGSPFKGFMLDRGEFDRALAHAAADAGARLETLTSLTSLDVEARTATVQSAGMARRIRFDILIAADGPTSPVATALGLPPLSRIIAQQFQVSQNGESHTTEIWLDQRYPGGYAWLFPKRDIANLGVGFGRVEGYAVNRELTLLHRRLVSEGRVGRAVSARTGGWIPVSGLRERLTIGPVLFVGDAGGFTHPITGAGIAPAVQSGACAGSAAAAYIAGDQKALMEYEEEMRELFVASSAHAVARRAEWLSHSVCDDGVLRRTWIAFDEYWS